MGGVPFSFKCYCSTSISQQQVSQLFISHSGSFQKVLQHLMSIKEISDLKVRGCFIFNMDTTWFECCEKSNYFPFTRLGLCCYFMEILNFMCVSLWIITSVLGFLFQGKLEYFISRKHVGCHAYHHVHCACHYITRNLKS